VVPSYRKSFFEAVAAILGDKFVVYASDQDMGILTQQAGKEPWQRSLGAITRVLPGMQWQKGAISIPIKRGDVVVVSGAPRCLSNLVLLLKARLKGARTIWWGQLWSASSRWHRFILRLLLMRLAHSVLFYTDTEVATYKERFGCWDRRHISALNNGIDVKPIQKNRTPYIAQERANEILFIGRLTEKAQLAMLLEAMAQTPLLDTVLHVIGDGPDRGKLQDWTQRHGIETRILWHGPSVDEAQIAQIANRSSVFCYPGSVGLSLIHAMAYGLPSVVHSDRLRHMPEIAAFEAGVTGAYFQLGDTTSLAQTLSALIQDAEARSCMSMESLNRADNLYNTGSMADRFFEMISVNGVSK
jgi:glycosyltransferase involved in cell wall biosynthesis